MIEIHDGARGHRTALETAFSHDPLNDQDADRRTDAANELHLNPVVC